MKLSDLTNVVGWLKANMTGSDPEIKFIIYDGMNVDILGVDGIELLTMLYSENPCDRHEITVKLKIGRKI